MPPFGLPLRLFRALAYFVVTVPLMPVQFLLLGLKSPLAAKLPMAYHRLCCRLLGISVERRGLASPARPTLYICNHTSYLDIAILGGSIAATFVAKADVGGWPLFGTLAKLQRCVFIDRRRASINQQRDAIAARLQSGESLILFPEGTSGDGQRLLPFKSSLFAAAEAQPGLKIAVQPVSLAYLRLDGMPLGRFYRPCFAWYGDMTLAPHLWTLLGLGRLAVRVTFHPPVDSTDFASRKELSEYCESVIGAGLAADLSGRDAARLPPPPVAATLAASVGAE
jgi:1-acyl-sn-glycerol-3-phosphate acyltransferase